MISVADPSQPTLVAYERQRDKSGKQLHVITAPLSGERHAYLATGDGVQIVSLSDPLAPTEIACYTATSAVDVYAVPVDTGEVMMYTAAGGGVHILRTVPLALEVSPLSLSFLAEVGAADPRTYGPARSSGRRRSAPL